MTKPKAHYTIQFLIYIFFLLSGATGLIYQVIWARLLGLSFGNTMYAISLVLATFMAGLGLGSYLVGRYLDSHPHPLRLYAILELGIGMWALLAPILLDGVDSLYVKLFPLLGSSLLFSSLLRFGLSSLILLIPTMLMGGTLPALTTHFTRQLSQFGRKFSLLYAVNTLGAVAGVWWVGFYALPWLGVSLTNALAALINLVIGAFCLWFDYQSEELPTQVATSKAQVPSPDINPKLAIFLVVGILVAGFSAMVYEIAWTRALIMVLGGSTFAFTCILMAFLVGISLGSFIYNWIGKGKSPGILGFCLIEALIGAFCLLSLPAFSLLPKTYLIFHHLLSRDSWTIQWLRFLLPLFIMIIPTTLMGVAFPLAGELYAKATGRISSGVGNVYGANTLGNVFGALLTGFLLLTHLGVQNSLKLAIILNLCLGAVGILFSKSRKAAVLTGLALFMGNLVFFQPTWNKYLIDSGVGVYTSSIDLLQPLKTWMHRFELISYKEGQNGIVTVYQKPNGDRFLRINGKADASNSAMDIPTQLLLGYVPVFTHPNPRNALVIGLGSGVTARVAAQYDFIKQVDCVEIEPAVVVAARFFEHDNHNLHQNTKVNLIIDDARAHLKLSPKSYDLIISEPSNPWMKGIGNLFSLDFYRMCRKRLNPGGIMCQWIHTYHLSPKTLKLIVNTFAQAFDYCGLWFIPSGDDVLILGSDKPIDIDLKRFERLINYNNGIRLEIKRDLAVDSPSGFLAYFMLNNVEVADFIKDAGLNTDNNPRLEFLAPHDLLVNNAPLNYQIMRSHQKIGLPENIKPEGMFSLADYYYGLSQVYFLSEEYQAAYQYIEQALKEDDGDPRFYLIRGRIYAMNNDPNRAIADVMRSLELDAENYEAHMELARIYQALRNLPEAQNSYQQAFALAPRDEKLQFDYANFLFSQGRFEQALSLAVKLTAGSEFMRGQIWEFIGDIHLKLENIAEARSAYEKSHQQNPSNYMISIKLGKINFRQGNVRQALEWLNAGRNMFVVYNPKDMRLLHLISDCYIQLKQYDKAAETLRELLRQDPNNFAAYQKLSSLSKDSF